MLKLERARSRRMKQRLLLLGVNAALAFLIIVICGYLFGWQWTGLPKQTLWDWLQLLIIPAVLAGVGLWFNRQQREQELQTADRRAQDEALQAYLDQIGQLLLDKNLSLRQAKEDAEVRTVARARTLAVLARLDGKRKGSIVWFLIEANLIQKEEGANEEHVPTQPVISLSGASLREADLNEADLRGADLRGADLSRARLRGADLSKALLSAADLSGADLRGAYLSGAALKEPSVSWPAAGARITVGLSKLFRHRTSLRGAILRGADLSEADLRGASVTTQQLGQARTVEGSTMPDGQSLKSDDLSNRPTFEEWLSSQRRKEDGKNDGSS